MGVRACRCVCVCVRDGVGALMPVRVCFTMKFKCRHFNVLPIQMPSVICQANCLPAYLPACLPACPSVGPSVRPSVIVYNAVFAIVIVVVVIVVVVSSSSSFPLLSLLIRSRHTHRRKHKADSHYVSCISVRGWTELILVTVFICYVSNMYTEYCNIVQTL